MSKGQMQGQWRSGSEERVGADPRRSGRKSWRRNGSGKRECVSLATGGERSLEDTNVRVDRISSLMLNLASN